MLAGELEKECMELFKYGEWETEVNGDIIIPLLPYGS